jgi:Bacterial archaeo-eukaryotic release factor family 3
VTKTQTIDSQTLGELASWAEGPCVSMYLPLDPKHPNIDADRLALKDLVADARRQLETTTALRRPSIDELLAPAEALIVAERWPLDHRGYAFFAAPGRSDWVDLDVDVPALSVAADRFVVTPLLAAVEQADRFFVLAISQNRVRFFRGGRERLVDVRVPDLPASRADALWYEDHERGLNVHGGSHQGVDQITGTIHGSPSEHDLRKQQLLRFFRIVNDALTTLLHDETAPLLVAGVGYELAIYREANRYPHLAGAVDTGSPERLSPAQLHTLVWPVAAELVDAPRRLLLDRLAATAEPLTSIPAIIAACHEGRIAALLAEPTCLVWGRPDGPEGRASRAAGDVELVSVAIGAALDQGATVGVAAPGELPRGATVAALARY